MHFEVTLYPRYLLIRTLQTGGFIKSFSDYCRVVAALERGDDKDTILGMPELRRWSEAVAWLKGRL